MHPWKEVAASFGFSEQEALELLRQPYIQNIVDESSARFHSPQNIKERIREKSLVVLEQSLPYIFDIITNQNTPDAARNEAVKTVTKLSGLEAQQQAASGATFSLTIKTERGDFRLDASSPKVIEGETE